MVAFWQNTQKFFLLASRMFKMVWEANPRHTLMSILFTFLGAVVLPVQIWITKVIIDKIVFALRTAEEGGGLDWGEVLFPIGQIVLVWLVGVLCQSATQHMRTLLGMQTASHTEYLIHQKASQLDIAFYETPIFYDKMENALRENNRAHNFTYRGLEFTGNAISLIGMLGLLWHLHPLAVGIIILVTTPEIFVRGHYAQRHYRRLTSRASAQRMAQYLSRLLASPETVKELRLFGLNEIFLSRFRHFKELFINDAKEQHFLVARAEFLLGLLSMAGIACIWLYAIVQAVLARITIGDVALAFQAAEQGRNAFRNACRISALFYEDTLHANNLFDFLDLNSDGMEGALKQIEGSQRSIHIPKKIRKGIEFRNVSFRYPRVDHPVLHNLSFTLRPKEKVAIVGENGAGKTTLIKLITRLYDPTEGAILLEGRDLREYDVEEWQKQIGVIFQDFVKYDLSVQENIGFGQVEYLEDRKRVTLAAEKGGAKALIDHLPKGLDSILGKTFGEGVDLSGGEWQKMALSRAFMRDAQILILDEPTSALDPLAEYEIYKGFADLTQGKMTIFISHRFSTVRMADHILVLEEGQLIEEGSHEGLVALKGKYAEMFDIQAKSYR